MDKRLKHKLIYTIFAISLLGVGFAAGQYYLNRVYRQQVEVSYRRALSEFATHFQELTAEVGRARVAISDKQRNLIGSNIRRLVYAAQSNMGELPLGELHLERIAHLLDKAYEQSYLYTQKEPDVMQFDALHGQFKYVNHELQNLLVHKEREFPWVSWHEYLATTVAVPNFMQTLALINDGLEEFKAPLRSGEIVGETVSKEQALEAARAFSGKENLSFQVTNESKGAIPSYTIEAKDEGHRIIIEVSQKGGVILWMTSTQEVRESRLSLSEIAEHGRDFLEQKGFPPLHLTDAQLLQHRATLTFVPERAGVLRYAEPIKIQVSAADGSILGFWGTPFYIARSRNQLEVENVEELTWNPRDKVQKDLEILDQKLALIQNEQREEILTARLGVRHEDEYYLLYLNAKTGEEEQIVQVRSPEFF